MKTGETEKYSVIYSKSVWLYFYELIEILLEEDYFSFLDTALDYVARIQPFIEENICTAPHHPAPEYFSKYKSGMKYIAYRANKRTT